MSRCEARRSGRTDVVGRGVGDRLFTCVSSCVTRRLCVLGTACVVCRQAIPSLAWSLSLPRLIRSCASLFFWRVCALFSFPLSRASHRSSLWPSPSPPTRHSPPACLLPSLALCCMPCCDGDSLYIVALFSSFHVRSAHRGGLGGANAAAGTAVYGGFSLSLCLVSCRGRAFPTSSPPTHGRTDGRTRMPQANTQWHA